MLFYVIKKVIYMIYVFIFLHWHAEFPAPLQIILIWLHFLTYFFFLFFFLLLLFSKILWWSKYLKNNV